MMERKSSSWFHTRSTGDPGRDRNARTLQFSCFLLAGATGLVAILNLLNGQPGQETLLFFFAAGGLGGAAAVNRSGRPVWAARTAFTCVLLTAILLVFLARDGFRSHAMLAFPGLLLISLMMLDRVSYVATAAIILVTVGSLGIAVKQGMTRAVPPVRLSYSSIFFVDLHLLVMAIIGGRIARDVQKNVLDLRAGINGLSAANLELVQIKEHLQESERRLKSAQRLTHVGSWQWDLENDRVVCSEECKRIFGQPEDYAPSLEGVLQIIAPGDRARVAGEIERGIAEKSGCATEFRIIRPNGDQRRVTFTSQVTLDAEGSPRHLCGACQDVTDARRAQEETLARQKLETVGTLANGIAHDFNNILGGVLTQAELALSELAAGASPEEELKSICAATMSGSEIVRQLMIYSGQERATQAMASVVPTVEEVADLLRFSISKHAALHIDLAKDLPAVRASDAQIRHIVLSLVMNASEAIGDRDGAIRLNVGCVRIAKDRPVWAPEELAAGTYVQMEVADTGKGMTPETQARVFDPFFTTKPLGHGLGLAVVSGIVRGLGGVIHLASEPGKGTTFRVLLPCADEATKPAAPRAQAEPTAVKAAATVLVVEDEDFLRHATSRMLRRSGFTVLEAGNGTAALTAIRGDGAIDVLLLDVTLPGAPSREVLAEVKHLRPEVRVIVTSAYGEEFAANSLRADVERFIRKPYSLHDLVSLLRQTLA